ncbi:LLM class flavin-dependent oxidoreductase [Bacillus sp. 03113]|uniref:LLM class flavin-dependent oxidoreductase n=1 Tax=Bacillus sp. 03113 TaxID=2578211 RepID=UPI001142FAB3|nr:LLM class flavin-dependent oxidoreductase [Bacillus sp. 03113]
MVVSISVLDQSPVAENESGEQALAKTVKLAQEVEKLGYHRFWVAEHHNTGTLAGSAPEALIGYLLAKTSTIKIGSGGVMLQHYSPYKVAEVFHVLSSLEPGRVNLGVGKAPGGFQLSTSALQQDKVENQQPFYEKLEVLTRFLHNHFQEDEPYAELKAFPVPSIAPDVFLLGGSVESAIKAAKLGISFVFAYFINGEEDALNAAREAFRKNLPEGSSATFILAAVIVVADSTEEAEENIKSREVFKILLASGKSVNVGTLEQVNEFIKKINEPYEIKVQKAGIIAGTKETVRENLERLVNVYDISEVIALTPIEDFHKKLKSYFLLKEAVSEHTTIQNQ